MALLKCPECAHDVSDKAVSCPNCGYPMNTPSSTKPRIRNGKPTNYLMATALLSNYPENVPSHSGQ